MSDLYAAFKCPLLFIDFEATGTNPLEARAIEIAGCRHDHNGRREFSSLINPGQPIPAEVERITGICDGDVDSALPVAHVLQSLAWAFADNPILIAHNALYDLTVLQREQRRSNAYWWTGGDFICTRALATFLGIGKPGVNKGGYPYTSTKLGDVAEALGLTLEGAHRAENDIATTEAVFTSLYRMALKQYRPILNALVHPSWAPAPGWVPERAVTYIAG